VTTHHGHHGHHGEHQHDTAFRSEAGIDVLELEGEALSGYTSAAVDVVGPLLAAGGVSVVRVVDLGCGPGVAACDLAQMFDPAVVVAADSSGPMLERASARAARLGRSAQVELCHVDLDGDLSAVGDCELVHASMALHHVRDEVSTLQQMRALVAPGGLMCLLERADPPRVELAEECGRPGLWDRIDDAWRRCLGDARGELPGTIRAEQYPAMLESAGFEVLVDEVLELCVELDGNPSAARFAALQLQRGATVLADHADPEDLRPLLALTRSITDSPRAGWGGAISATRSLMVAAPR